MELVADRFVVANEGVGGTATRALDLATGEDVLLLTGDGRTDADRAWASRCEWFQRLRHRAIAPLLDYGSWGASQRFEVWRCGAAARGDSGTAKETRTAVGRFLEACGRTTDAVATADVHDCGDRYVVVPPPAAGFEAASPSLPGASSTDGRTDGSADGRWRALSASEHGVLRVDRPELRDLTDALIDAVSGRSRALALWGVEGSGLSTATTDLARTARLQGIVPLAVSVAAGASETLRAALSGRSVLLIDRGGAGAGWSWLVERARSSPRSHVLLLVGRREVARVEGLGLARLSERALVAAVQPAASGGHVAGRVLEAARCAHGLPGRFVDRLWGTTRNRGAANGVSRAAERAPEYDVGSVLALPECGVEGRPWAATDELTRWRESAERAVSRLRAGRTTAAERELRAAVGALVRRSDWLPAVRGLLALAAAHLARGRPREAQAVLREIDTDAAAGKPTWTFERQAEMAVLSAAALGDLGGLEEASQVLSTTLVAARGVGDQQACRSLRLALARCRFWLGEYDEGWHLLAADGSHLAAGVPGPSTPEATRLDVRYLATRARLEVGRGRHGAAIADAGAAVRLADRLGEAGAIAVAAHASAFAFLAIGDAATVDRDAARAVAAARAAHDPMRALKARLLAAECGRRVGRCGAPASWLRRASQLTGRRFPVTVQARIAVLIDHSGLPLDEVVRRRISATGLRALALFSDAGVSDDRRARDGDAGVGESAGCRDRDVMEDVLDLLRCCQGSEGSADPLTRVLSLLRDRLRASGVGCYLESGGVGSAPGGAILVAVDGRRPTGEMAARVLAAPRSIAPHTSGGGIEGGSPVRFDGRILGAFVARWSIGTQVDATRASALLATAATAAAPAVAAAVHARQSTGSSAADDLLGISHAMHEVRRAIESAAAAPYAVLVEGESGSGKELVARAVHRRSPRKDRPFCALNCAALPDDLLEAELFGHVRGAFTGAIADRLGVFEAADGGTVFLDEIGELSPRAQAKLLRTVQEGEIRRVGENVSRQIDVRIVAATNRNLRQEVAAGRFRLDLLYRLDVVRISLMPLRARREDIPVLVDHYWREVAARVGTRATLSAATLGALSQYDWPGNVRELQNVLASLAVRGPRRGVVLPSALPVTMGVQHCEDTWRLGAARRTFEEHFVRAALVRTGGHRARAAQELGVSRQGRTKLMTRLGIRDNQNP